MREIGGTCPKTPCAAGKAIMTLRAWGLASNDEAIHPQEQCTTPQETLRSSGST